METRNSIIEGFEYYAGRKHEGQKRKTIDLLTGEPESYAKTHLKGVVERSQELLSNIPLSPEDYARLEAFPELAKLIAWGHDLIEDCLADVCQPVCIRGGVSKPPCAQMPAEITQILLHLGLNIPESEEVVSGIKGLTKDGKIPNKEGRQKAFMEQLRTQPFYIKLIKIADQWHNLSSLAGFPFEKAVAQMIEIRKSWEQYLLPEEMELLVQAGYLEPVEIQRRRTEVLEMLLEDLQKKQNRPETREKYRAEIDRMIDDSKGSVWVSPEMFDRAPKWRIVDICCAYDAGGPALAMSGEEQIRYRWMMELETLSTLTQFLDYGFEATKNIIRGAIQAQQLNRSTENYRLESTGGIIEKAKIFLDTLGVTGKELLEMDSVTFFDKVNAAIKKLDTHDKPDFSQFFASKGPSDPQ
jgi:hypothetical protein